MRSFLAALLLCLMAGASPVTAEMGNATPPWARHAPAVVKFNGPEVCIASVYGTKDHDQNGTKTASGIPLNDRVPSMAHKSRPLRSDVVVINLQNGRALTLKVTDRGPHVKGRCVDLSLAAAILLGCKGLCPVRVD